MDSTESPLAPVSTTKLIGTFEVAKLIESWKNTFNIDISNELRGIKRLFLYRCEASQLDFFTPLSAAGSEELYRKLQKFDWFYMPEKWEFEVAIKDLATCKRILEIGCGQGFFIEKAVKNLKSSTVKGIELNEAIIEKAHLKNLPVERMELRELVDTGEKFDAICCFQVLEHVKQPREFLRDIIKILVPGGKLILSVPNKESYIRHQYKLLDMPPHHMTKWCAVTFKYLEILFPLKTIRLRFEPLAKYHIANYVEAYGQYWCVKQPAAQRFLPKKRLHRISEVIEMTGLYRFLRGQSLYGLFERL